MDFVYSMDLENSSPFKSSSPITSVVSFVYIMRMILFVNFVFVSIFDRFCSLYVNKIQKNKLYILIPLFLLTCLLAFKTTQTSTRKSLRNKFYLYSFSFLFKEIKVEKEGISLVGPIVESNNSITL